MSDELVPIEYECEGVVTIRRCPKGNFWWGVAPAYWYLRRPIFTMDAPEIGWPPKTISSWQQNGFTTAYWDGEKWYVSSPKQFATPQEAMVGLLETVLLAEGC